MIVTTVGTDARSTATTYLGLLADILRDLDLDAVVRLWARLQRARDEGGSIFLAGNGGSTATASHWANDLGKATKRPGCPPIRVISLGDHVSWLTALGNDEGYDRIFAGQLENFVSSRDVLVVLSASGNSPNLVQAVHTARAAGATTLGLLGFDGGILKTLLDDYVWLPTPKNSYGQVEDVHLVVCHLLTTCLATVALEPAGAPFKADIHGR